MNRLSRERRASVVTANSPSREPSASVLPANTSSRMFSASLVTANTSSGKNVSVSTDARAPAKSPMPASLSGVIAASRVDFATPLPLPPRGERCGRSGGRFRQEPRQPGGLPARGSHLGRGPAQPLPDQVGRTAGTATNRAPRCRCTGRRAGSSDTGRCSSRPSASGS